jgi:hypothetical protein
MLMDIRSHMSFAAMRFDGYKYEHERLGKVGAGSGLSRLSHAVVSTGELHSDDADNFGAFFILQRFLCKWGGEQLGVDSPEWQAFAKLFLHLMDKECPREFVWAPWAEDYEQHRHRNGEIAGILREHVLRVSSSTKQSGSEPGT